MTNRLNRELRALETTLRNGLYAFMTTIQSSIQAPKIFFKAWNHVSEKEKLLWRDAILKELKDMNTRSVYKLVSLKDLPRTRTLVGNKWVYTIKRDGRHWARLVALGYTQIPGVDCMTLPSVLHWYWRLFFN